MLPVALQFYLASRSPRRQEILSQLGLRFAVLAADIDESVLADEKAEHYVLRLAEQKALAVYAKLPHLEADSQQKLPVLAADTTVCVDGQILGKPADDKDALAILSSLAGGWHEVHTALALATEQGVRLALSSSRVQFAAVSTAELQAYIATGEPHDKAGAYGIQGLASIFIQRIEGSYSGIMGLPIFETTQLLKQAGIQVL
jgi:septum formation protein